MSQEISKEMNLRQRRDHIKKNGLQSIIWVDKDRMSGYPCFRGTRVTPDVFFGYLDSGTTLEEFAASFHWVPLEFLKEALRLREKIMPML